MKQKNQKAVRKILLVPLIMCIFMSGMIIDTDTVVLIANAMDSDYFSNGNGTKENPYIITNAEQFDKIRTNLSAYYMLANDIDLSGYDNWKPIGDADNPFVGGIDGQDNIINGLKIDYSEEGLYDYIGLFGNCINGNTSAEIKRFGKC